MAAQDNSSVSNGNDNNPINASDVGQEPNSENCGNVGSHLTHFDRDQLAALVDDILAHRTQENIQSGIEAAFLDRLPALVNQIIESTAAVRVPCKNRSVDDNGTRGESSAARPVVRASGNAPATHLACSNCQSLVPLPPSSDRWYSVWVGRRVGWVRSWDKMDRLTRGVSGQGMQHCDSAITARALFADKLQAGAVVIAPGSETVMFALGPGEGELFP